MNRVLPSCFLILMIAIECRSDECLYTVRVVDEAGIAVPNALVSMKPYCDGLNYDFPTADEQGLTDSEGRLSVVFDPEEDRQYNNVSIRVEDQSDRVGYVRIYPPVDADKEVVITVGLHELIQGHVRDAEGKPVPDVTVGSVWFPLAVTDSDGYFRIHGKGNGAGTLSFYKEGYSWLKYSAQRGTMNVTLKPGIAFTFETVDEEGRPFPGATIRYHGIELESDANGIVEAIPVDPSMRLYAYAQYRDSQRQFDGKWEIQASQELGSYESTHVRFIMKPTALDVHVAGKVIVNDTGEPVEAKMFLAGMQDHMEWGTKQNTNPTDGTFLIHDAARQGPYLEARPKDPTLYALEGIITINAEKESVNDIVFTVAQGWAIRGQVILDDPSKKLGQASVVYTQRGELDFLSARMDNAGNFVAANIPPDVENITLRYGGQILKVDAPPLGEIVEGIRIELPSMYDLATVSGRILDENNDPLAGATVTFRSAKLDENSRSSHRASAETNIDGQFRLEVKYPGDYVFDKVSTYVPESVSLTRSFAASPISIPNTISVQPGSQIDDLLIKVEPTHPN